MPTLYDVTVPALFRGLAVLSDYMDRAVLFADEKGLPAERLFQARLAPDMLPLSGQVQIASDHAKNGVSRLAGVEAPRYADDELTLADLKGRIEKTVAYLKTIPTEAFVDADDREIKLAFETPFDPLTGSVYVSNLLLPNFYFHVTTAHAILRHQGVAIGKRDYLGRP